ncbi:CBD9-like protein [Wilcoxina mikolae CBS 423.85]|nr:CBD9-like protein [Wilcoxina mikolae CBS 423.85]
MVSLRSWSSVLGAVAYGSVSLLRCWRDNRNICGSINIPSSGSDTYFRVQGPVSAGWSAVGIGSGMAGALIFVVYPSASGKNVTVSPRLGRGHSEPQYSSSIQITLLDGSGVSGNTMTANFRCANCRSWSGNTLDTTSTKQNFIWASGPGDTIKSDDESQNINQHFDKGNFQLNLVTATGGSGSVNPFTSTSGSTGNSGTSTGSGSSSTDDSKSGNTGGSSAAAPVTKATKVLIAHGVIMALTWVILFPLGAAFIRLLGNYLPNAFVMHRTLQLFNVCLAIVGMSLGMWTSGLNKTHFTQFHQYFGVILVGMLFVQGALGQLHHSEYQQTGKRSVWSYLHIWVGRTVIVLAIINGGIGLGPKLANANSGQIAAYSIVALVVVITYSTFYFLQSRGKGKRGMNHRV